MSASTITFAVVALVLVPASAAIARSGAEGVPVAGSDGASPAPPDARAAETTAAPPVSTSIYAHPRHFDRRPAQNTDPGTTAEGVPPDDTGNLDGEYALVGIGLWGSRQSHDSAPTLDGLVGGLQLRTSKRTLVGVELMALDARNNSDQRSHRELGAMIVGRLFPWDWVATPYLALGAGLGRGTLRTDDLEIKALHVLGTAGLGLELRLGANIVLDAQAAQSHRFNVSVGESSSGLALDADAGTGTSMATLVTNTGTAHPWVDDHDQALELRAGLTVRF